MNIVPNTTRTTARLTGPGEITETVVSAVADAEGTSPLELRPLVKAIDPDALETLFREGRSTVTVEFDYQGYCVRVSRDERVTVEVYSD